MRIDPAPSVAWASGTIPAATAAAEPPEEPPAEMGAIPRDCASTQERRLCRHVEAEFRQIGLAEDPQTRRLEPRGECIVLGAAAPEGDSGRRPLVRAPASPAPISFSRNGTPRNGASAPGRIGRRAEQFDDGVDPGLTAAICARLPPSERRRRYRLRRIRSASPSPS